MTITPNIDSGTYTDTPGDTWDTLQDLAVPMIADGVFVIKIDLSALVAGETFEVRIQEENPAGTLKEVEGSWRAWTGVQAAPVKVVWDKLLTNDWNFQARQRNGTGRAVPWWIDQVT